MPTLVYAFTAGEFLAEELEDIWVDGYFEYNPDSQYPYEWWMLK
jgi:hypothetical protein